MFSKASISNSLLLGGYSFLLWCWTMILSGDIPVSISIGELWFTLISILTFAIIGLFNTKKTNDPYLSLLLLSLPVFLWGFSIVQDLTYHYHIYSTIISITGFIVNLLITGLLLLKITNRVIKE